MAKNQPIIVIRRGKKGGHGHHGGAWKVAYADFVTAMMAFFLLMWLITAMSDDKKEAIAYYFATGSVMDSSTLGGETILPGAEEMSITAGQSLFVGFDGSHVEPYMMDEQQRKFFANREQELFERAKIALEEALRSDPELYDLIDNIVITKNNDGLNIQLIDQEDQQLFASGSDKLTPKGLRLTALLAKVIIQMPQQIAIEGHTDSVPFSSTHNNYSNWELSADRALALRRRLLVLHLNEKQTVRVAGYAATQPYLVEDPTAPQNRRISITLLSDYTAEAIKEAKEKAMREAASEKVETDRTATKNTK